MRRRFDSLAVFVLLLTASGTAAAQSSGFALDRFDPSERGSRWFALDSLDFRGNGRVAAGVIGDYGYKPLVIYNNDDSERAAIVKHQLFAHIGLSVNMWDKVRLAANIPTLLYTGGDSGTLNGAAFSAPSGTKMGDLRLGADVALLGRYGSAFSLAGGLQVFLPTGSKDSFASDGTVRVVPHFLAAGELGGFVYAGKAGVNIRPQTDSFAGSPMGSELAFGLSFGWQSKNKKIVIGPELWGTTVFTDSDALFKKRTTPFEAILGTHIQVADSFRVGAGFGPGLTRGFGEPQLRGLLSLEYAPGIAEAPVEGPKDRDQDGILDKDDACPDVAGIKTDDPKTNGCPPPSDRDNDGIFDDKDACVDVPGIKTEDPKTNGCPPPADRDKDGILDEKDACPDVPGPENADPAKNGCPPPADRDKDTIIDEKDACPDTPGPADPDPKKNGCPAARIEQGQIKIIQQVKFDTGKSTIRPESDTILTAVMQIMKEHPEIELIHVEGHTDNRGNAGANKTLSRNRAAAVVKWLTSHGIDAKRFTSAGLGQERAIDSNDTEAGRQNNRRVEFHIVDKKAAAPANDTKAPKATPQPPAKKKK